MPTSDTARRSGFLNTKSNSVDNSRDAWDESGLQNLGVFYESERISGEEPDASTNYESAHFINTLVLNQRKKGEIVKNLRRQ
jgi:hypothetical protein